MSGLEKIIEHINNDATETAAQMIENARKEAEIGMREANEAAKKEEAQIRSQTENDIAAAVKRIDSAADLRGKRLILEYKQRVIDSVFDKALEYLDGLNDEEYFKLILKMVSKYAHPEKGEIVFSPKDKARLPENFEAGLSSAAGDGAELKISDETAKIRGGFILNYGLIEENCSFEAIIESNREVLQDKVGQVLFD